MAGRPRPCRAVKAAAASAQGNLWPGVGALAWASEDIPHHHQASHHHSCRAKLGHGNALAALTAEQSSQRLFLAHLGCGKAACLLTKAVRSQRRPCNRAARSAHVRANCCGVAQPWSASCDNGQSWAGCTANRCGDDATGNAAGNAGHDGMWHQADKQATYLPMSWRRRGSWPPGRTAAARRPGWRSRPAGLAGRPLGVPPPGLHVGLGRLPCVGSGVARQRFVKKAAIECGPCVACQRALKLLLGASALGLGLWVQAIPSPSRHSYTLGASRNCTLN